VPALLHPQKPFRCLRYRLTKATLIASLFFCANAAFSQDVIYTLKGAEIKCKVREIGEDSISYADSGAVATAPQKLIVKKEVNKIRYANGWEDVITAKAPEPLPAPVTVAEKKAAKSVAPAVAVDVIFTTDGQKLAGKVTEIEDNIINYVLADSTAVKKIDTKNVLVIKYSTGHEDFFNTPGKKPDVADVKVAKKTNNAAPEKDTLFIVLQNWKRKYISPPLEIF